MKLSPLFESITGSAPEVLFPDWLAEKLSTVHGELGQGSIFNPNTDISGVIESVKSIVNKEPDLDNIANSSATISTTVPNIGYNLVLPIDEAKSLPDAELGTTEKSEGPNTITVPLVKTSEPISSFKTDLLTIIVVPLKNEAQEVIPNNYIILSIFPGTPNIPRASEWNDQYAVIVPTT